MLFWRRGKNKLVASREKISSLADKSRLSLPKKFTAKLVHKKRF